MSLSTECWTILTKAKAKKYKRKEKLYKRGVCHCQLDVGQY